jgi:polygalacturonase
MLINSVVGGTNQNITFRNITFTNTTAGVRIKTRPGVQLQRAKNSEGDKGREKIKEEQIVKAK